MIDFLLHIIGWGIFILLMGGFIAFLFKAFRSMWENAENMFKR